MVLVDTSVWIRHFREGCPRLAPLLIEGEVWCHPFVVGELACGNLRNRSEILAYLQELPMAQVALDREVLAFIDANRIFGAGVGLIDVHMLASAELSDLRVWTLDKRLEAVATRLGLGYT
jgi:hypothetical protein